ncbi:MAG: hypothetical protein QXK90_03985 [Candidatus Parvarchaeota archaeon]
MDINADTVFSLIIFTISLATLIFSALILLVLYKHRVDRAPMLSFFLNKEKAVKHMFLFIYPGIFMLLFGISMLLPLVPGSPFAENTVFSYLPYIFGGISILFIAFINYRWFGWFRRFAR